MNNKKLGNDFEKEVCEKLSEMGFWVHFIAPDIRGAQPFDVIAAKDGIAYAIDCKTSVSNVFRMSRLEDNQIMAFEKWIKCGNTEPMLAVKYKEHVYFVQYLQLKTNEKVDLKDGSYMW